MNEMIDKMREMGLETGWYSHTQAGETPNQCSRLSQYLLKGDYSYTVKSDGTQYLIWKKLKTKQKDQEYYCSGCKKRWRDWQKALEHLKDKG